MQPQTDKWRYYSGNGIHFQRAFAFKSFNLIISHQYFMILFTEPSARCLSFPIITPTSKESVRDYVTWLTFQLFIVTRI